VALVCFLGSLLLTRTRRRNKLIRLYLQLESLVKDYYPAEVAGAACSSPLAPEVSL
jgi:hypothetical protein